MASSMPIEWHSSPGTTLKGQDRLFPVATGTLLLTSLALIVMTTTASSHSSTQVGGGGVCVRVSCPDPPTGWDCVEGGISVYTSCSQGCQKGLIRLGPLGSNLDFYKPGHISPLLKNVLRFPSPQIHTPVLNVAHRPFFTSFGPITSLPTPHLPPPNRPATILTCCSATTPSRIPPWGLHTGCSWYLGTPFS